MQEEEIENRWGGITDIKQTEGNVVPPYLGDQNKDAETAVIEAVADSLPLFVPEITAMLRDAIIDERNRICGFSIAHVKGWADGAPLRTSPIVAAFTLYQTQSGSYYLVTEDTQ